MPGCMGVLSCLELIAGCAAYSWTIISARKQRSEGRMRLRHALVTSPAVDVAVCVWQDDRLLASRALDAFSACLADSSGAGGDAQRQVI